MTRIQRRIFTRGIVVGMLLTIIVMAADSAGVLAAPENWLYDLRARYFQFFTPKPTDQLVHVDIDDRSLEQLGAWPWPRERLAGMLDEMQRAGVKAVALDVLFTEPQEMEYVTVPGPDETTRVIRTIDNDAEFAAAVARLGNVVIPSSFDFEPTNPSPGWRAIVEAFRDDPGADEAELVKRLGDRFQSDIAEYFITARKVGMYQRISMEMSRSLSHDELRAKLLGDHRPDVHSPLSRVFEEQYDRWRSAMVIKGRAAPGVELSPPPMRAPIDLVPLPALAEASAAGGFVDFTTDRDGVLRSVPLLVELDGRLVPQVGLSLALRTLGVEMKELVISDRSVSVPLPEGRLIRIPVEPAHVRSQGRHVGLMFNLPWFGSDRWEAMYDWPDHAAHYRQHIPLGLVWAASDTRRKIVVNNENVADILPKLQERLNLRTPATATTTSSDDPDRYGALIDRVLAEVAETEKALREIPATELDQLEREYLQGVDLLRRARVESQKLARELLAQRAVLSQALAGKSALIGWTSTGMLDMTVTSLHARCPGVISHGVVFNSILTGEFWRRAPFGVTLLATLVLGLFAAVMASWLSPMLALGGTVLLALGYVVFNGLLLFDQSNLIVGQAAPLGVLAAVWAGCTLNRIIMEANERARITRRFRAYNDPTLVDFIVDNPELVRMDGETRELTVVFTDLKGFTAISERLGEQTVQLLNEYMGRMVPIIRAQKGYVNKFLGDGIMFFFGAPIPNSSHAAQAVEAVLEMQKAVDVFNQDIAARGLPAIGMRVGISSGMMVVGDAGSAEASDYTVLGDTVNLGARLESANKAVGTRILINARTAELLDNRFLLRPVGRLQVVGKEEGVMVYEAMDLLSSATEHQKKLAARTTEMVEAFVGRKFDACMEIADAIDREFGPGDLTALYREQCGEYLRNPPEESFDGRIKLTEK